MAFTGMSYEQFVADQKRKGITVQGGDGSYNRYTAAQSSGQAGSGYKDSGGSGANRGAAVGAGIAGASGAMAGAAAGSAAIGGAVAGTVAAPAMIAGAVLGHMFGGKRPVPKTVSAGVNAFDESQKKENWQKTQATDFDYLGEEFTSIQGIGGGATRTGQQLANMGLKYDRKTGRWMGGDDTTGGNEWGYTGGKPKAQAPAPAPPAPRSAPRSAPSSAPPPAFKQTKPTQKERDEITKPASGLEDTIKTSPKLLRERRRRTYLTSGA